MTLHNYKPRQVHRTLNWVNPSSSFRDMRSAKSGPNLWQVFGPWASPYGTNAPITMTVHNYRPKEIHRTSNGENPSSGYRDMGSVSLAAARPPEPWRQYPSSPKGWGVKFRNNLSNRCTCHKKSTRGKQTGGKTIGRYYDGPGGSFHMNCEWNYNYFCSYAIHVNFEWNSN